VVLLDLMMPGMSGTDLLRAVAAEPALATRDAYIIFTAARPFSAPTLRLHLPDKRLFDLPSRSTSTFWSRLWSKPRSSWTTMSPKPRPRQVRRFRLWAQKAQRDDA
jgi:hypothetical protein